LKNTLNIIDGKYHQKTSESTLKNTLNKKDVKHPQKTSEAALKNALNKNDVNTLRIRLENTIREQGCPR